MEKVVGKRDDFVVDVLAKWNSQQWLKMAGNSLSCYQEKIILNDKKFKIPYKLSCKQHLLLQNIT